MKKIARIFIFLILLGAILEANTPEMTIRNDFLRLTSLAIEGAKTAAKPVINILHDPEQVSRVVRESIEPLGDILVCHGQIFWDRVTIALEFIMTQIEYGVSPVKGFFHSISNQLS